MTKRLFLLSLLLFLLTTAVAAATEVNCKYTKTEEYSEIERMLVYEGTTTKGGEDLLISEFSGGKVATFAIKNPNPFKVMVILNFTIEGAGGKNIQYGKFIEANDSVQIREVCRDGENVGECSIKPDSLIYHTEKPSVMYPKAVEVRKTRIVCERKPLGDTCLVNTNCDSDFCVQGICSDWEGCYLNDCKCSDFEVQCSDNKRCATKDSIEIGSQPICSAEECKTRYINENGLCDKAPIPVFVYILIAGGLACLALVLLRNAIVERKYLEKERKERLVKEIEKLKEESDALKRKKVELSELSYMSSKSEKLLQQVNALTNATEERMRRIEEANKKLTEVQKKGGIRYWRNPKMSYYPCYVEQDKKTDRLVHREIAFQQIFNHHLDFFKNKYPHQSFGDLEVHHIDHEPDNFDHRNLVIISKEEHRNINHTSIPVRDFNKGIEELRRVGIINPHIKRLVKKSSKQ